MAAAAALLALGGWSVLSVAWGGNANGAWLFADRSILAASALLVGGLVRPGLRRPVADGVAAGLLLQALELLGRVGGGVAPEAWFYNRVIDGPLGYHNGQAAIFAVGLVLVAPGVVAVRGARRAAAGAAVVLFLSALLVTQSRGALAAATLGLLATLVLARDARLAARMLPLPAVAAVLILTLRRVDTALLATDEAVPHVFAAYVGIGALLAAGFAGAVALPLRRDWARGLVAVAAGAFLLAFAGWLHTPLAAAARDARAELASDTAPLSAPGSTRYASLSLNGRHDMWRVALDLWGRNPVLGAGQGGFTRAWTEGRHTELYVLQPHSIELELGAELGAVGLGLFGLFLVCAVRGLGPLRRPRACAAAGATVALLAQASTDWTWSFPGLVVPVLVVLGVTARGRVRRAAVPGRAAVRVTGAAVLALAAACLLPSAADRSYRAAARLAGARPAAAATRLDQAQRLNPWNAEVISLQGDVALAERRLQTAAARYDAASRLSLRPWLALYARAGVLQRLGATRASERACRAATSANPLERALRTGACAATTGLDRREGSRTPKAWAADTQITGGLQPPWRP